MVTLVNLGPGDMVLLLLLVLAWKPEPASAGRKYRAIHKVDFISFSSYLNTILILIDIIMNVATNRIKQIKINRIKQIKINRIKR